MPSIVVIILVLTVFIVIFLILREVNCWYWKINERIVLMQEQNDLLKKIASNSNLQVRIGTDNSMEKTMPKSSADTKNYLAPEILSQSQSIESSAFKGSIENIHLEFADGIKGSIFHKINDSEYYFKEKSNWSSLTHRYNNLENCINAFHYFETTGKILQIGFVGSFS